MRGLTFSRHAVLVQDVFRRADWSLTQTARELREACFGLSSAKDPGFGPHLPRLIVLVRVRPLKRFLRTNREASKEGEAESNRQSSVDLPGRVG